MDGDVIMKFNLIVGKKNILRSNTMLLIVCGFLNTFIYYKKSLKDAE